MSGIKELICYSKELSHILPLINGITIIEYDGEDINGSIGLHDYMLDNALLLDAVDRIIVCGKPTDKLQDNIQRLKYLFPSAKVEMTKKKWRDIDFYSLDVLDTLVFHFAAAFVSDHEYDHKNEKGRILHEAIRKTRHAYYACVLSSSTTSFDTDGYCLRAQLRLADFEFEEKEEHPEPTNYCRDKQDYMEMCEESLTPKDLFFQTVKEAEHGCEECNQCKNYGKRKLCPVARRKIAGFYRKGMFVPKNETIAHQWEVMAARQGYKPAKIQVAEDLSEGFGCCKSIPSALRILKEYARENDDYCINRIIQLVTEIGGKEKLAAIPFMAHSAMNGNEEMILRLSNALQEGDYGLPKDMAQQEEWIRQGAENGNPRFVLAMAEMYEANGEWAESYKWYKNLSEINPDMLPNGKFEEIELKMLTNGASDEEIAQKGMDYLHGFHGKGRDMHLAFRCLSHAKEKGVALAEGLLGQMYYFGLGLEKNKNKGEDMILNAARHGDMLSCDCILRYFYTDNHSEYDARMRDDLHHFEDYFRMVVGHELKKGNPIACYMKGSYQYLFHQPDDVVFYLMKNAADMGYPPAQYRLAKIYEEGRGTVMDRRLYWHWLETAANNGHYEAEGEYGKILFDSWMNSNKSKAFRYLKNAYDKGCEDDDVCWYLAQCYMYGHGTTIDKHQAYPLYISAAE